MQPRYDWWRVQALRPDLPDGKDLFFDAYPTELQAVTKAAELKAEGWTSIGIAPPDATGDPAGRRVRH